MMNYLFLVVIVFAAVKAQLLTPEEIEKLKKMHNECMKESSVDTALMQQAMNGEYADDQKLKDHIFCANKKLGFQNESGDINEEAIIKKLIQKFANEELIKAGVKLCAQKKDNPTETAFQLIKCLHSKAPKDLDVASYF